MLKQFSRFSAVGAFRKGAVCGIFSTFIFLVSALLLSPCFMDADQVQAYSISGTVTNNASTPGQVYVSLDIPGGTGTGLGVSMLVGGNSSTPYTIHGLFMPGSYAVSAFLDTTATGFQYANSPAGATGLFSFSNSNVPGVNVSLSSPGPVGLTGLSAPNISTTSNAAIVMIDQNSLRDNNGRYIAESVQVYWSIDSVAYNNLITVSAIGFDNGPVFIPGLSGSTLNVKIVPVVQGVPDIAHQVTASAPIGSPAGSTVSGKVISTGIAKSPATPLYLAAVNDNGAFITYVGNPADAQAYSIPGVAAGTYRIYSILDMNNNGFIDIGDIQNNDRNAPVITVDGTHPAIAADIYLAGSNAAVTFGTRHGKSNTAEWYGVNLNVRPAAKLPVSATITGGAQISSFVPIDLVWNGKWGEISVYNSLPGRPQTGDMFFVQMNYADGSSEDLSMPVTAVLDNFAMPIYPIGDTGPDSTQPLFAWSTPMLVPAGYYAYRINVSDNNGSLWDIHDTLHAAQLSLPYNSDGNASISSLTPLTNYYWIISVEDAFSNQAQYQSNFIPQISGPSISGFNPSGGSATTPVTISGGFSGGAPAVYFGGQSAGVGSYSAGSVSTAVPSGAPAGPVTVAVNGITAGSQASFTSRVNWSGSVADINGPPGFTGATVSTVGLSTNPNYGEVTTSSSSGSYSLNVPSGVPFYLHLSNSGYLDAYTSLMSGTYDNSGSAYTLFTIANLTGKGITWNPNKGLISARVSNLAGTCSGSGGPGSGCVSGAVVTATSKLHPDTPYTVAYTVDSTHTGGTATGADGRFYVLNADEGDYVTVTASHSGWGFQTRTYVTHANSVSQNKVKGNPVVRVQEISYYSTTIQDAYNNVTADGQSVQMQESDISDAPIFNGIHPISLQGGFDISYSTISGFTTLHGSVTFSGGAVTVGNLTVQ